MTAKRSRQMYPVHASTVRPLTGASPHGQTNAHFPSSVCRCSRSHVLRLANFPLYETRVLLEQPRHQRLRTQVREHRLHLLVPHRQLHDAPSDGERGGERPPWNPPTRPPGVRRSRPRPAAPPPRSQAPPSARAPTSPSTPRAARASPRVSPPVPEGSRPPPLRCARSRTSSARLHGRRVEEHPAQLQRGIRTRFQRSTRSLGLHPLFQPGGRAQTSDRHDEVRPTPTLHREAKQRGEASKTRPPGRAPIPERFVIATTHRRRVSYALSTAAAGTALPLFANSSTT